LLSLFLIGVVMPIIVIYLIAWLRSDGPNPNKDVRKYFPDLRDMDE